MHSLVQQPDLDSLEVCSTDSGFPTVFQSGTQPLSIEDENETSDLLASNNLVARFEKCQAEYKELTRQYEKVVSEKEMLEVKSEELSSNNVIALEQIYTLNQAIHQLKVKLAEKEKEDATKQLKQQIQLTTVVESLVEKVASLSTSMTDICRLVEDRRKTDMCLIEQKIEAIRVTNTSHVEESASRVQNGKILL